MNPSTQQPVTGPWPGHGRAPASVFHYTSGAGFLGMIQTGHLWASEAAGLNDYSEITAGQAFVRARWAELRQSFEARHGTPPTEVIDGVLTGAYPKLWVTGAEGAFVVCASRFADDANQWRLYADDGRGFSVELDTEVDLEVVDQTAGVDDQDDDLAPEEGLANISGWRPVMYSHEDRSRAFDDLLAWIGNHQLVAQATTTRELVENLPPRFSEGRMFNGIYQFIKTPGFAGENESRIVVTFAGRADDFVGFRATKTGIVRTAQLRSRAVPLAPTNRTSVRPLPIRRVIMGPAQRYDLGAPAVRALLDRHGYTSVEVVPSEASLRWS